MPNRIENPHAGGATEHWDESDQQDLETTEALQAYAWKALELAEQHFARIDTKEQQPWLASWEPLLPFS